MDGKCQMFIISTLSFLRHRLDPLEADTATRVGVHNVYYKQQYSEDGKAALGRERNQTVLTTMLAQQSFFQTHRELWCKYCALQCSCWADSLVLYVPILPSNQIHTALGIIWPHSEGRREERFSAAMESSERADKWKLSTEHSWAASSSLKEILSATSLCAPYQLREAVKIIYKCSCEYIQTKNGSQNYQHQTQGSLSSETSLATQAK